MLDIAIKFVMYIGWVTSSFLAIAGTWVWRFTTDDPNNPDKRLLTPAGRRMRWVLLMSISCGIAGAIYSEVSARQSKARREKESKDARQARQDTLVNLARLEASLSEARSSGERANREMTLLLTSPHYISRKIQVDIPLNLPEIGDQLVFEADIRDYLFPGWRSGEFGVALGELTLISESDHFRGNFWFIGDPWEPPIWLGERESVSNLCRALLRAEKGEGNSVDRRIWDLLSKNARNDAHLFESNHFNETESRYRIRDEMTSMLNRTDLYDRVDNQDIPRRLKGVHGIDLQSLPIQELRGLNSRLLADRYGTKLFTADADMPVREIFSGADGARNPHRDGLGRQHRLIEFLSDVVSVGDPGKTYFRMTVQFEGEHALSDWLSDLESGRSILVLENWIEDEEMLETAEKMWGQTLAADSALVRLPVNASGSVALSYRAVHSNPELILDGGKRLLQVVWQIDGGRDVVSIDRDQR